MTDLTDKIGMLPERGYCRCGIDDYPSVRNHCEQHLAAGHPCETCINRDVSTEVIDLRHRNALLCEALGALGAIGNGYCFCSEGRDPDKARHQPECADARAILAACEVK